MTARRAAVAAVLLLLLAASFSDAKQRQQSKPAIVALVLANVGVVDVRSGSHQPDMTVIIREGRVTAIAKQALVQTGREIQVVNATGKYLVAGRWDMQAGRLEGLRNVDVGQAADLILLDAYPLRDLRDTHKVWAAVVSGKFLDRPALDKMLAESQAAAKQGQAPKN